MISENYPQQRDGFALDRRMVAKARELARRSEYSDADSAVARSLFITPLLHDFARTILPTEQWVDRSALEAALLANREFVQATTRLHETDIRVLSELTPLEYEQRRKEAAERFGIRTTALDQLVKQAREGRQTTSTRALNLVDPEPWPDPVPGDQLLALLVETLERFIALPDRAGFTAIALWILHAFAVNAFDISPRLGIVSPVPRCGKTTVLKILGLTTPRALHASNITNAAIFRTIEAKRPTLLIDEADTFLVDNDEMRGVLNSGHDRRSAFVVRCEGEAQEPSSFSTWAPVAIGMIGRLPATLADRAVLIEMRRRLPSERVERLERCHFPLLEELARKAARWTSDVFAELCVRDPALPEFLDDRARDNWRPLFSIAELAGGPWPQLAEAAARKLNGDRSDDGVEIQLLADIKLAFVERKVERLFSKDLCEFLVSLENRPWAEYARGKSLTPPQLARRLRGFRVAPATIRIGSETAKGYELRSFEEAFGRYLASRSVTTSQPNGENESDDPSKGHKRFDVTDAQSIDGYGENGCDGVTADQGDGDDEVEI